MRNDDESRNAATSGAPDASDSPTDSAKPTYPRRVYVASSWRNARQPSVVTILRSLGHEVYDFRNPSVGWDNPTGVTQGFRWDAIDPDWQSWEPQQYRALLQGHPVAASGFQSDWQAMQWANTCVLLLPSGRSAHLEGGYFADRSGKELHVLLPHEWMEPELMYLMADGIHTTIPELAVALAKPLKYR